MQANVAVVLTAYKRTHLLERQIAAIKNQTVQPSQIVVWRDSGLELVGQPEKTWGVWPRFVVAQFLPVETIAVFDDDTIPGPRFIENCYRTAQVTGPGVLGACGQSYVGGNRQDRLYHGWKLPSEHIVECDIAEHAWFFPRDLLLDWTDAPYHQFPVTGEQYYISVIAQRRGWKTWAVAHPPKDQTWWGAIDGFELGTDKHALWMQPGAEEEKQRVHDYYLSKGWQPSAVKFDEEGNLIANAKPATWVMG